MRAIVAQPSAQAVWSAVGEGVVVRWLPGMMEFYKLGVVLVGREGQRFEAHLLRPAEQSRWLSQRQSVRAARFVQVPAHGTAWRLKLCTYADVSVGFRTR